MTDRIGKIFRVDYKTFDFHGTIIVKGEALHLFFFPKKLLGKKTPPESYDVLLVDEKEYNRQTKRD